MNFIPILFFLILKCPEPGMTGIELLQSFEHPTFQFVFVTAYAAYAIEAFRLSAVDYLLKPIDADDIVRVIEKVKKQRGHVADVSHQLRQLQSLLQQSQPATEFRIGIAMSDKIVFLNINDILYCEAQGAYTNIYLSSGKKVVSSKSLGDFESQLKDQRFFRTHHSILINLNKVKEFQKADGGYVMMENDKKLEVSQRKRKDFLDAINGMIV
jgi:two-component system, LytTR family, response regulator